MTIFPSDGERCMAQTRCGIRCSRRSVRTSTDGPFRVDMCRQHWGEADIQRLFVGCSQRAILRVLDRDTRGSMT